MGIQRENSEKAILVPEVAERLELVCGMWHSSHRSSRAPFQQIETGVLPSIRRSLRLSYLGRCPMETYRQLWSGLRVLIAWMAM
jgi:hypothetical protein